MTKLSSSLPKGYEEDGLSSINRDLVNRPEEPRMIVAMVDCKSIPRDMDSGLEIATARILHIEPLDEREAEQARDMLQKAQERRTGRRALPLEQVDAGTGEISFLRAGHGFHPGKS